jgi:hypothetical protein
VAILHSIEEALFHMAIDQESCFAVDFGSVEFKSSGDNGRVAKGLWEWIG